MRGLAVSQIIMLVLGIIVLAVIGFLLYSNFLTSTGQLDSNKCLSKAIDQCRASVFGQTVKLNLQQCMVKIGTKNMCNFDTQLACDGSETTDCSRIVGSSGGGITSNNPRSPGLPE